MEMKINTRDVNAVLNDLDQAGDEIIKALMEELLLTALMIESGYKSHVLVDTGRLRSSIWTSHKGKTSYSYTDQQGKSYNGKLNEIPKEQEIKVGTNVNYAIYVEERWKNYAMQKAFERETEGLQDRLNAILK